MIVFPPRSRRKMPRLTAEREYRLRRGVTLVRAAVFGDFTLARASEIERFPERAHPGELERLREAVDRATDESLSDTQ